MTRAYRAVRLRAHRVYSVEDVIRLYTVCRNTVSNWVRGGLRPFDRHTPQLFRGAELARFHNDRRARSRKDLRAGEFKCFGCKGAVFPEIATLSIRWSTRTSVAQASCPDCGAHLVKLLNETECDTLQKCFNTNTSLGPSDEEVAGVQADIGKCEDAPLHPSTVNDRLLYRWQSYAGRYDSKTQDAHLSAIREFERFLGAKPFEKLCPGDAEAWRAHLLDRNRRSTDDGGLSQSSVRHRAGHLRDFATWLGMQAGLRHLNGIEGYFALPRALRAGGGREVLRAYPTLVEAVGMLAGLPDRRLRDRRDRAILALAFAAGLREQALISLRLWHVDMARRQVNHDGETIRAKNGKSFVIDFFPRTDDFQQVVGQWIEEARALGLRPGDALFPELRVLENRRRIAVADRPAILPMTTAATVDSVFRRAGAGRSSQYTPHAARHTLAQLGNQLCRTPEQRKAWSQNLGHTSKSITWQHYGRVSDMRKAEILAGFDVIDRWTYDEMTLMLEYHEHRLWQGTPEFEQAKRLVERYREGKMAG